MGGCTPRSLSEYCIMHHYFKNPEKMDSRPPPAEEEMAFLTASVAVALGFLSTFFHLTERQCQQAAIIFGIGWLVFLVFMDTPGATHTARTVGQAQTHHSGTEPRQETYILHLMHEIYIESRKET